MSLGILDDMTSLDFKSPFDELKELRAVLTTQEIADLTGLRRETISRARPDSRFQRRTERALGDLYLVVTKMRSMAGGDVGQLAAVLRRPQAEFAGRSMAELLREGHVDVVLESLSSEVPVESEGLAKLRPSPEIEAGLEPWAEPSEDDVVRDPDLGERVDALLEADPELRSRLNAIEAVLVEHFGPGAEVERKIISDYESPERSEGLYLRVHTDLSFEEEVDRLGDLLRQEQDLLAPVLPQLTIGFLG